MYKFIHFPSTQLQNKVTEIKITKELSENPCEETQVARNIVSHGWRKRLDNGVDAEYSLDKLYDHKKFTNSLNMKYEKIY